MAKRPQKRLQIGYLNRLDVNATSIGDENIKRKLANAAERKQILRDKPSKDQ